MIPIIRDFERKPHIFVVLVPENEYTDFMDKYVLNCPENSILILKPKGPKSLRLQFEKKLNHFEFKFNYHSWEEKDFVRPYESVVHEDMYVLTMEDIHDLVAKQSNEEQLCWLQMKNAREMVILPIPHETFQSALRGILEPLMYVCGYLQTNQSRAKPSGDKEVFQDLFSLLKTDANRKVVTEDS